jgi:hypothetical protein
MDSEHPVLDAIAKAKRAQQLYDMNNNVQLEMTLYPEQEEDHVGDDCPDEH